MDPADTRRDDTRFLLLLLLGGVVLRLIWLIKVQGGIAGPFIYGEASRIALAVAREGSIADAYYRGYGPTAHLLPVVPGIVGFLLWLTGPGTAAASVTLLTWSLAQMVGGWLLLRALFGRLGVDPLVTRWAMVLLCLAPVFVQQETIDFRYWDGAAGLCLAVLNMLQIQRYEGRPDLGWRDMFGIAALSAVTFFTCPPVGLATNICWAIFALRRLKLVRCIQLAALSAAALAMLVTPWAVRNAYVLGEPVLLRSNLGADLALANHPDAVSGRAPETIFADRLWAITPWQPGPGRAALANAGGEVAYARQLGDETWRWIAANPGSFAMLSLRHLSELFFPRPWQMYFSGWEEMRTARALTISLVNLLGLIGLALGLWQRRRGYWMLAVYLGVVAMPFAFLQPTVRYVYFIYGVLAFLAVEAVLAGVRAAASQKGPGWAR